MQIRVPIGLRKLKDSGKRRLFIVPYFFTFANACLGLLAVLYAWDDLYRNAAYCIILAALSDALDGRLARILNSCSSLGMELDSLCDAISFCFAPAILMYGAYLYQYGVIGIIVTGIYLCAGLYRLAKFNNTCGQQKICFMGMSTPIAAIVLAVIIVHEPWIMHSRFNYLYLSYVLPFIVMLCAYLMVSSVKFPTFKAGLKTNTLTLVCASSMIMSSLFACIVHSPISLSVLIAYIGSAVCYHVGYVIYRRAL